jgi:hypothetical protein
MHRFVRRPSPALVVSALALLFALSGTGIAAMSALPRNSVGAAQLKANAVTNAKIKNAAVNNAKLAKNAVTSSKVQDGSLTKNDFAPDQIPAGPQGPQGPAGAPGASGYQIVTATSPPAPAAVVTQNVIASCPSGKKAVGGGAEVTGDGKQYVALNDTHPHNEGAGWYAEGAEVIQTPQSWQVRAYAICATVAS